MAQIDRDQEWYTVAEAAQILRLSSLTVRKLVNDGKIPVRRDGRKFLIHRSFLLGLSEKKI